MFCLMFQVINYSSIPTNANCMYNKENNKSTENAIDYTKTKGRKNKELITNSSRKSQSLLNLKTNLQRSICCDEHIVLDIECHSMLFEN